MSKKRNRNHEAHEETVLEVVEQVEAEVVEEVVEHEKPTLFGSVVLCEKLNIRKTPSMNGEIVQAIECGTKVVIDEENSTNDFYKICTAAGVEGFCVKKYIAI